MLYVDIYATADIIFWDHHSSFYFCSTTHKTDDNSTAHSRQKDTERQRHLIYFEDINIYIYDYIQSHRDIAIVVEAMNYSMILT